MKKTSLLLLSLFFYTQLFAQSYEGKDFWVSFMQNSDGKDVATTLQFVSRIATQVTIEVPQRGYSVTISVPALVATSFVVPTNLCYTTTSEVVTKNGIHISSLDEVTVYPGNYKDFSSDAATAIPTGSLGTSYNIVSYGFTEIGTSEFIIIATEDNTQININLSGWTDKGKREGDVLNVVLNKGETYLVKSYGPTPIPGPTNRNYKDLTGTLVNVTNNKKIAIYTGNSCVYVDGCPFCDHLYEQLRPHSTWGQTHYIAPTSKPSASFDIYRVYALNNNTNFTVNGVPQPVLNARGYVNLQLATGTVIEATDKVYVAQYLRGSSCSAPPLEIDPLMLDITPKEQYASDYLFATSAFKRYTKHYATIIIPTSEINSLRLNTGVIPTAFTAITGTTYSYGYLNLAAGTTYSLVSLTNTPFGLFVYGYGAEESYGYTAGGKLLQLNGCPTPDFTAAAVCVGTPTNFVNLSVDPKFNITATNWEFGDGSLDNTANPNHIYINPGVYNVKLTVTNNRVAGGPCSVDITKQIAVYAKPTANAGLDKAACLGTAVNIGGTPSAIGGTPPYTYNWLPNTNITNNTLANPNVNPNATSTYTLTVTDKNNCKNSDPVDITVPAFDSLYFTAPATICKGSSYNITINVSSGLGTYTVKVSDGVSTNILTNVSTNYQYTVNPTQTTAYKITEVSSTDPKRCIKFSPEDLTITTLDLPLLNFTGTKSSICEGTTVKIDMLNTNSKPINFTYAINGTNTTISNHSGPYSFTVTPTANTTINLLSVSYSSTPSCTQALNSSYTIQVNKKRNPGLGTSQAFCESQGLFTLNAALTNTPETDGTWIDLNNFGGLSSNGYTAQINTLGKAIGTYKFEYKLTGLAPCPDSSALFSITLNDAPKFTNVISTCSNDLTSFTVKANVSGGNSANYNPVNGTISNSGGNFLFTSSQFSSPNNYTIEVSDGNSCGKAQASNFVNCGCKTFAGTMNQTEIEVCETNPINAVFNNDNVLNLANNDTLLFILHEGSINTIVNPIAQNNFPVFSYVAGMSYGRNYYISSVVGPRTASGIDFSNPTACISVAQGTPIKFHKQVQTSFIGPANICAGTPISALLSSVGTAPFTAIVSDGTTNQTFSNLANTANLNLGLLSATSTFNLLSIEDLYCKNTTQQAFTVLVNTNPTKDLSSELIACDAVAENYIWSFSIQNGDPTSYTLSPSSTGNITGSLFTSNPIPSGASLNIIVNDQYNCAPQSYTVTKTCACISSAGTFNPQALDICEGGTATTSAPMQVVLDPNDRLIYVLHSVLNDPNGSRISESSSPSFIFMNGMSYETPYYISAVVGNASGNSSVNYNDHCLSISNTVMLTFHKNPILVSFTFSPASICAGEKTARELNLLGNAPFTLQYSINGIPQIPNLLLNSTNFKDSLLTPTTQNHVITNVTDKFGCTSTGSTSASIAVTKAPSYTISGGGAICYGDSVPVTLVFTGIPPYNFTLNDGLKDYTFNQITQNSFTTYLKNLTPATYLIRLSSLSDAQCKTTDNGTFVNATVNELPTIDLVALSKICNNDAFKLGFTSSNISAGFDITIDYQATSISKSNLQLGSQSDLPYKLGENTYQINYLKDLTTGCINRLAKAHTLTVNPLPEADLTEPITVCQNETAVLKLSPKIGKAPFSALIKNNIGTLIPLSNLGSTTTIIPIESNDAGTFSYNLSELSDANGCKLANTGPDVKVEILPTPKANFNLIDSVSCAPLHFKAVNKSTAVENYDFTWLVSNGQSSANTDTLKGIITNPGKYDLTLSLRSKNNCLAKRTLSGALQVYALPIANFVNSPTTPTIIESTVQFINQTVGANSYSWLVDSTLFSSNTTPSYTFNDSDETKHTITLHVKSSEGCIDSIQKTVLVKGDDQVYMPNSFTPNGDRVNDTFKPVFFGVETSGKNYEMLIYNRWGEELFKTNNPDEGWDGTYLGQDVASDVYNVVLRVKSKYSAKVKVYNTAVSLLR